MGTVYTIGEALIDFIPTEKGLRLSDVRGFTKKPGGAPANVAVTVAKLGGDAAFIGKLGMDAFGSYLVDVLRDHKVNVNHVVMTDEARTALAFVSLSSEGERDFSFYRNPSADMLLSEEDMETLRFCDKDILHFCSVDLIEAPVKYAHLKAIHKASKEGALISFDPNVRLPLWKSPKECKETIIQFLPYADIIKVSDEELEFLTETTKEEDGIRLLTRMVKEDTIILVTKGSEGVILYKSLSQIHLPAFKVAVRDTTGAGDAFIGSFLYQLAQLEPAERKGLKMMDYEEMLTFSNAVGGLTTMKEGAISALPQMQSVREFIKVNGRHYDA